MDSVPFFSDSHIGQMSRLCCGDPFATSYLYPETPSQLPGPDDLPLLALSADQFTAENFYHDPYGFPFQVPCGNLGRCEYSCGPAFIRKRNERERQRVKCVNEGYAKLRHHLPAEYLEKRLSKVETLRAAIKYIRYLQSVLYNNTEENRREACCPPQETSQGECFKGMDNLCSSVPPCHSRWSRVVPIEAKPICRSFITNPSLICSGSLLAPPACLLRPFFPARSLCHNHCSGFPDTTCNTVRNLEGSLDALGIPVLARRDTDGYYYLGTIIKKVEGEKRAFLVQFTKPFPGEDTTCMQTTASSDILEYVNGIRHSILPGDKVLAPWEPEQKRYGPGTVILGLENRDPLRAKEDEEITVSFWNGKKARVPLGVALWVPPRQWERIVEMIHMPLTSRTWSEGQFHQANSHICSCRPVPSSMHACTLGGLLKWQWPYCPSTCPSCSCFHHTCPLLVHKPYVCCCLKPSGWLRWPSSAELSRGGVKDKDFSSKLFSKQLALEDPPKDPSAIATSRPPSCSSDSQSGEEQHSPKPEMKDHAVNTDFTYFDKPKLKESKRPDWKYWKRSRPSSFYSSQGTSIWSSGCGKKRAETNIVSSMDRSPTALVNHSAMFEAIEQSPRRPLTVKEILTHETIKPFSAQKAKVQVDTSLPSTG